MRLLVLAVVFGSASLVSAQTTATKRESPITINIGDMESKKPEVLGYAKTLKKRTDTSSEDYTARYFAMIRGLKVVGSHNLTEEEKSLIMSVTQPDESAVQHYLHGRERSVNRANEKTARINQWFNNVQAQKHEEKLAKLKAEQEAEAREAEERRQAEINRIEERKAEAMEDQARALQGLMLR